MNKTQEALEALDYVFNVLENWSDAVYQIKITSLNSRGEFRKKKTDGIELIRCLDALDEVEKALQRQAEVELYGVDLRDKLQQWCDDKKQLYPLGKKLDDVTVSIVCSAIMDLYPNGIIIKESGDE